MLGRFATFDARFLFGHPPLPEIAISGRHPKDQRERIRDKLIAAADRPGVLFPA